MAAPQLLQWMWADAGMAPGDFFAAMAKRDPFRWSAKMTSDALKLDLLSIRESHVRRPVRLRLCDQTHDLEFTCIQTAIRWIDEAQQKINGPDGVNSTTSPDFVPPPPPPISRSLPPEPRLIPGCEHITFGETADDSPTTRDDFSRMLNHFVKEERALGRKER